jgi:hypothetical protein
VLNLYDLYSPPLFERIHLSGRVNEETAAWNEVNLVKASAFLVRRYIHVKREKSSMNIIKYRAPPRDGTLKGPQISV